MADRKALFALLADAQRLVTLSKQHRIRVQKQVVADLERGGKDSSSKQGVLRELQDSHRRHVETRDQIREQLSFR